MIDPKTLDQDWVYFQLEPSEMTFLTRVLEGYEYLGVVTALNGKVGTGFVRTVPDTQNLTTEILETLPISVRILSQEEAIKLSYITK